MFNCDKCGLCCANIADIELYKDLDRGDGVCKYLKDSLCSIYENRPLLCRIDNSWKQFYSSEMSLECFYELNYKGCKKLKEQKWRLKNVLKFS